jgi:DNA replication protein DnaD
MGTAILNTWFRAGVGSLNEISHKSWCMEHGNEKKKNSKKTVALASSKHVSKQ